MCENCNFVDHPIRETLRRDQRTTVSLNYNRDSIKNEKECFTSDNCVCDCKNNKKKYSISSNCLSKEKKCDTTLYSSQTKIRQTGYRNHYVSQFKLSKYLFFIKGFILEIEIFILTDKFWSKIFFFFLLFC